MRTGAWALALVLCGCATWSPQRSFDSDWLPLRPGVRWVYDAVRIDSAVLSEEAGSGEGAARTHQIRVEGLEPAPGGKGVVWRVYTGDGRGLDPLQPSLRESWLMRRAGHAALQSARVRTSLDSRPDEIRQHASVVRTRRDAAPGMRWMVRLGDSGHPRQLQAEVVGFEDVETPAGRFPGCLEIRMSGAWRDGGSGPDAEAAARIEIEEWWARGVGKVKHVQRTWPPGAGHHALEVTLLLREFHVEPPPPRAVRVELADSVAPQGAELIELVESDRHEAAQALLGEAEEAVRQGEMTTGALSDLYGSLVGVEQAALDRWVERGGGHRARAARGIHLAATFARLRPYRSSADRRLAALELAAEDLTAVLELAAEDLTTVLELHDDHVPTLRALLDLAMRTGDARSGYAFFARAREVETDPLDAYVAVVDFVRSRPGAEGTLLALLDDAESIHGRGALSDRIRSLVLAEVALLDADRDPERTAALWEEAAALASVGLERRAAFYRSRGRFFEALADLDRAMDADPVPAAVVLERSRVYEALGYHDLAFADLQRLGATFR